MLRSRNASWDARFCWRRRATASAEGGLRILRAWCLACGMGSLELGVGLLVMGVWGVGWLVGIRGCVVDDDDEGPRKRLGEYGVRSSLNCP